MLAGHDRDFAIIINPARALFDPNTGLPTVNQFESLALLESTAYLRPAEINCLQGASAHPKEADQKTSRA